MRLLHAFMIMAAILLLTATSCKKDNDNQDQYDVGLVTGTYSGTISETGNLKNTLPATATVRLVNDSQLEIHCFSDLLDTTIIMDCYPHGDSLMLCATGNQFMQEYGHEKGKHHSGHHGASDNDWGHHMGEDHDSDDKHYGGFDINHHRFGYTFRIQENSGTRLLLEFIGERAE